MKTLLTAFALLLTTTTMAQDWSYLNSNSNHNKLPGLINEAVVEKIMCGDKIEIKDHMARMGMIIRNLRELVSDIVDGENSDDIRAIVMLDSQVLRTHMAAVFPKTPKKIKKPEYGNLQFNKNLFQRYLLKMMEYTLEIESELLNKPMQPDEIEAQRLKIASLIIKIDETVEEAHGLFRD